MIWRAVIWRWRLKWGEWTFVERAPWHDETGDGGVVTSEYVPWSALRGWWQARTEWARR